MKEKLRIYSLRIFINIIVIAILSGCFYSIYRVTVFSQESSNVSIRNDTRTDLVKAGDYSKRNYCERVKYLNIAPFMQGSENAFYRLTIFFSRWEQEIPRSMCQKSLPSNVSHCCRGFSVKCLGTDMKSSPHYPCLVVVLSSLWSAGSGHWTGWENRPG